VLRLGTLIDMTPVIGPSEGLNAAVAAELRAALARKKWSVNRLSEEAEIPYGSLRRYLNAERHIDVSVLYALCWAMGVRPQELVGYSGRAAGLGSPAACAAQAPARQ